MPPRTEKTDLSRERLSRPRVNLYLDVVAFLALLGTVVTGLVLRLVLPPGSGRVEAGSPERPIGTLWGFARHEWGALHYNASLVLLGVLALHLWLHRDWITSMGRRESQASGKSFARGLAAAVALIVVALSPLWSEPSRQTRSEVLAQRGESLSGDEICYSEDVALTAFELERITGVPQGRFLAHPRPLTSVQTRQIIEDYYAGPSSASEGQGEKLFISECLRCHGNPASLPDLGATDSQAFTRLREAQPAAAHQKLRNLSDGQLLPLVLYLRANRSPGR